MTARAVYSSVPYSHPDAVDLYTYAGNRQLVPCRYIHVNMDLKIPEHLRGKELRVKIVLAEVE